MVIAVWMVPMSTTTTLTMQSPIGALRLYEADDELIGLYMSQSGPKDAAAGRSELLLCASAQLAEYFDGKRKQFDLPLGLRGTAFQIRVWQQLLAIPHGETWSYGELAQAIGQPTASRAVGAANGKNPISIIVPCHRVIGSSGELTGYGGGMPAKRWLLDHEKAIPRPRGGTLMLGL
jgi:methylated-DNA-[protein]-cysteine S-methyltransferase